MHSLFLQQLENICCDSTLILKYNMYSSPGFWMKTFLKPKLKLYTYTLLLLNNVNLSHLAIKDCCIFNTLLGESMVFWWEKRTSRFIFHVYCWWELCPCVSRQPPQSVVTVYIFNNSWSPPLCVIRHRSQYMSLREADGVSLQGCSTKHS